MIGTAKAMLTSGGVLANYSVSISPGSIDVNSNNGGATSPVAYSTVLNGVGPFDYSWEMSGSNILINSQTSSSTSFSSSGFNVTHSENATLTVTDTGNGNVETFSSINVSFDFFNAGP